MMSCLESDFSNIIFSSPITDSFFLCKDRVYPELQNLLGQQDNRVAVGRDTQWELMLAQAACLRDICRER